MSISPHSGQPTEPIVGAEEPERGPQPLAHGELDPRFEPPFLPGEETGGLDPARRVVLPLVALFARDDREVPVSVEAHILGAVRVVLELVVPPVRPDIEAPPGRVGGLARGPLELVGPHEPPFERLGFRLVLASRETRS